MAKSTSNSISSSTQSTESTMAKSISSTQSQDNTMTTLYIDNGVSINLTQYLSDPIGHIERVPPMFRPKTVGEKLAIAEFTKNTAIVHEVSNWLNRNLKDARYLAAMKAYNEAWDGLLRANPNGYNA